MKYFSTRGKVSNISFKDAVMMGLAEDGGLLLPQYFPKIDVETLRGKNYQEIAYEVLKEYADDIDREDFKKLLSKSYQAFDTDNIVPLADIKECFLAELFHGPTLAFKDIALQFLGNLFEYILAERSDSVNIIGATSGDTGSAAIYGVRGKKNVNIAILYPNKRVSSVQEMQMTSVMDDNVLTLAVKGTFDDCQNLVKSYFNDANFKKQYKLGAVNSINWARIMAQIVYYFYAYLQLPKAQKVNFVVPTGNFGNIFAGYAAYRMGLPINKLVLATNENDILHRFISKGDYSLADVKATYSPSMDIQVASNLERYLYFLFKENGAKVSDAVNELKNTGKISFSNEEISEVQTLFMSYGVTNKATEETIKRIYDKSSYVIDPHTACAVEACHKLGLNHDNTIVMSTAHPAKFPDVVKKSLGIDVKEPDSIIKMRSLTTKTEVIENDSSMVKERLKQFFS